MIGECLLQAQLTPRNRGRTRGIQGPIVRYVPSSIGTHPLFEDSGAFKPAMVALDVAAETLDRTQREELLRG